MKTTLLSLISFTALLHTVFAGVNTANVDVWVRHAADIDRKGRHIWYGDNLYDNNTVRQPQERWITVPLNSSTVLSTQSFFFNIQVDAAHSNFLWLRTINGHDFHTTARPGFKYDPAKWDVVLSFQRADGTWAKVTDYIMNWRKHYPHGDGFPLGPVGPTAKTRPNVLFRMDITPKVMPKSGTGITLGLYSLTMFAHSDFAAATVTYK